MIPVMGDSAHAIRSASDATREPRRSVVPGAVANALVASSGTM